MDYIVRRNFSSHRHNGIETKGDKIPGNTLSESTAKRLIQKGLIAPTYSTKEDKRAAKVQVKTKEKATMKHDVGAYFLIVQGEKVVDRIYGKQKAKDYVRKLNEA